MFESSIALRLGLGAAVDHALGWGLDEIARRTSALAERLRQSLGEIDRVTVHDKGVYRCGIVTFAVDGIDADIVNEEVKRGGINTSVTRGQWAQYDFPKRGLTNLVRAS